jgi:hypothetical protein
MRLQSLVALFERPPEHRLRVVERAPHADVLRSLTGEEKRDRRRHCRGHGSTLNAVCGPAFLDRDQLFFQLGSRRSDDGRAVREDRPPDVGREAQISDITRRCQIVGVT